MVDGTISDEKFKEVLRLIKSIALKVGENAKEIALLRTNIDKNTRELKNLKKEIRTCLGLDIDANFRILEINNRLSEIERRVKDSVRKAPYLKEKYDRIRSETSKVSIKIGDNPDVFMQLDELDVWVENLEEKVFARG